MNDFNHSIIEEFHANGGKVGGPFEGIPLLLLTTTGAKSGKQRINPVAFTTDDERLVIVASKNGAPTHPDWYHNIVAHPDVTVEVGTDTFAARTTVVDGAERDKLFASMAAMIPVYAEYQAQITRTIPVVVLTRKD